MTDNEDSATAEAYSDVALPEHVRFSELLNSNTVPTEVETRSCREFIALAEQRMHDVSTQMEVYRELLDEMEHTTRNLAMKIEQCSAVVRPTRHLDADVLSVVFERLIEGETQTHPKLADAPKQDCWKVTQVCRLWRRVATSSPRLWNYISVSVDAEEGTTEGTTTRNLDRMLFFLNLQLAYSRRVELYVSLFLFDEHMSFQAGKHALIASLLSSTDRWVWFHLTGNPMHILSAFSQHSPGFPRIRELHLGLRYFQGTLGPVRMFTSCNNLCHVSGTPRDILSFDLPWSTITNVSMPILSSPEFVEALKHLRHLKRATLHFHRRTSRESPPQGQETVFLPNLEDLDLIFLAVKPAQHYPYMLRSLLTPSLTTLSIHQYADAEAWDWNIIFDLIQRSNCAGTLRVLSCMMMESKNIVLVLQVLTKLEKLSLQDGSRGIPRSEDHWIQQVVSHVIEHSPEEFLPSLVHLRMDGGWVTSDLLVKRPGLKIDTVD